MASSRAALLAARITRPRHPEALRRAGLSAAATTLVLLITMAVIGIFPFGDRALSSADGPIQYAGFFGWMHRVLTGQANLQYSFATALGGNTFPLFAYYLSSPFSLLAAFVNTRDAMRLLSVIWPLKLMLASATCGYYLTRRFGLSTVQVVALASSYVLAPWMLRSGTCVMWLDGVYLLPIVSLGIWKLVRGESPATLFWGIGLAVLFNWYAGYMCCAFAVLQFVTDLVGMGEARGASVPRLCLRFAGALLLGVALGAVMLLPTVRFMGANPVQEGESGLAFIRSLTPDELIINSPLKVMALVSLPSQGLADLSLKLLDLERVFATAVPMLLLAGLTAIPGRRAQWRQKLAWLVATLCLYACLVLLPLNMALTGFSLAESYNPRFMFLILMALVHCTAIAFDMPREERQVAGQVAGQVAEQAARQVSEQTTAPGITLLSSVVGTLIILLLPALAYQSLMPSIPARLAEALVATVMFALVGVAGKAGADVNGAQRRIPMLLSACGLVLVLATHLWTSLPCLEESSPTSLAGRDAYFDALGDGLVSGADGAFFRAESTDPGSVVGSTGNTINNATTSDHFGLGVNGLAHYSSVSYHEVSLLLGKLGYTYVPTHRNMSWYASPLLATDAVLGVSRVLAPYAPAGMEYVQAVEMPEAYGQGWALYQNPGALSLGFGIPAQARSVEWGESSWWNYDAFENQTAFVSNLVGHNTTLYTVAGEDAILPSDAALTDEASISASWLIVAPADGPLYVAQQVEPVPDVLIDVSVDGSFVQTAGSWAFDTNVLCAGEHAAGDVVELRMEVVDKGGKKFQPSEVQLLAATLDVSALDEALSTLRAHAFVPSMVRDGVVEGTYTASGNDALLLTIPYDVGWKIEVDGVSAEAEEVNGLTKIPMTAGEHRLSMRYTTPGLRLGLAVSTAALVGFVAWRLVVRKLKRVA